MSVAVQLEWQALGHGIVGLVINNAQLTEPVVVSLAYPEQGSVVGDPPRDEQHALKLNAATLGLNRVLRELSS